jgi:hypothetical protein
MPRRVKWGRIGAQGGGRGSKTSNVTRCASVGRPLTHRYRVVSYRCPEFGHFELHDELDTGLCAKYEYVYKISARGLVHLTTQLGANRCGRRHGTCMWWRCLSVVQSEFEVLLDRWFPPFESAARDTDAQASTRRAEMATTQNQSYPLRPPTANGHPQLTREQIVSVFQVRTGSCHHYPEPTLICFHQPQRIQTYRANGQTPETNEDYAKCLNLLKSLPPGTPPIDRHCCSLTNSSRPRPSDEQWHAQRSTQWRIHYERHWSTSLTCSPWTIHLPGGLHA